MGDVQCTIRGLDQLEKILLEQAPKIAAESCARAATAGADVLKTAIEAGAPKLTGFLTSEIQVRMKPIQEKEGNGARITVDVGPDPDAEQSVSGKRGQVEVHNAADEAQFAEFGTRHEQPRPFIRPAFEQNKSTILGIYADEIKAGLDGLASK